MSENLRCWALTEYPSSQHNFRFFIRMSLISRSKTYGDRSPNLGPLANSAGPKQRPQNAASDQGLHYNNQQLLITITMRFLSRKLPTHTSRPYKRADEQMIALSSRIRFSGAKVLGHEIIVDV